MPNRPRGRAIGVDVGEEPAAAAPVSGVPTLDEKMVPATGADIDDAGIERWTKQKRIAERPRAKATG